MKLKNLFSLLSLSVLLFACNKEKISGSGAVTSQQRNVTGFTGVVVNGSTKAFISLDTDFKVTVKGYENLLSYLETNVINGVLQVGFKNNVNIGNDNTEVHITLPLLNAIQTNGNGDMAVSGTITGINRLKATVNGSADIAIEKGNADEFVGEIIGNGNILALGFQSKDAQVNISGDGNVEISASNKLDVTISGNGKVYYRGSPTIKTNISGNGQVIPK